MTCEFSLHPPIRPPRPFTPPAAAKLVRKRCTADSRDINCAGQHHVVSGDFRLSPGVDLHLSVGGERAVQALQGSRAQFIEAAWPWLPRLSLDRGHARGLRLHGAAPTAWLHTFQCTRVHATQITCLDAGVTVVGSPLTGSLAVVTTGDAASNAVVRLGAAAPSNVTCTAGLTLSYNTFSSNTSVAFTVSPAPLRPNCEARAWLLGEARCHSALS